LSAVSADQLPRPLKAEWLVAVSTHYDSDIKVSM
jgi:hypothetical protein